MDFEAAKKWAEENLFERTMNELLMLSTTEISAFKDHVAGTKDTQIAERDFVTPPGW